jgi:hypothetical protein
VTARRGGRASVLTQRRGVATKWSHVKGVRRRRGSELDRGHPGVHAVQRGAPAHPTYVAMRARRVALRRGLDGTLSASSSSS